MMAKQFDAVVAYVSGDDTSELALVKAELAYALMSLEREIAIGRRAVEENARLRDEIERLYGVLKVSVQARE